jgi:hypothetical protein
LSFGASPVGTSSIVLSALFPCIFLLIVSESEITVAGADAPFRAFNTFVEVGFKGLKIVFLCPSTLLNGVSVVLTSFTDAFASVWLKLEL